jgi:uncharacterized protein (TIGR04551 family)
MSARLFTFLIASTAASAMFWSGPRTALAQMQPGTPPPGTTTMGPEEKPEGVAEQAPSTPGTLPTTPVLPPPRGRQREFQLLELDGYYRFRGDWFKKFHLGFDDQGAGGAPFPQPTACLPTDGVDKPCEDTLKSANMRLRLEPVIHIDEKTSVHIQADLLDNLVFGSTPAGLVADGNPGRLPPNEIGAFTDNQDPPSQGKNLNKDSILIKRAWAEVETAFGLIKFGRQPSHWGMGMFHNGGGFDPIHGTYDLDADYGDTVDRVSFSAGIPGTEFRATIAMDWGSTAPTAAQADLFANQVGGQPWDLDDNDDLNQWTFVFSRLDSPVDFLDRLLSGELGLNYGLHMTYRTQKFEQTGFALGEVPDPDLFQPRDYKAYMPNVWLHLGLGDLEFELEGMGVLGSVQSLGDLGINDELDLRQFGAVGRITYHFLNRELRVGGEGGFASGDQWDNAPQGATHIRSLRGLDQRPGDSSLNQFIFDPDYKIDLILFRELMGAITNAIYVRPSFEYDITDWIRMRVQNVTSFAHKRVATPGNGIMYGVEFDGDVEYHKDGFSAGIAYGVLFPLGALDHPQDSGSAGGPGFGYADNAGDAGTAQTIQLRMMLKF